MASEETQAADGPCHADGRTPGIPEQHARHGAGLQGNRCNSRPRHKAGNQ